MRFFITSVLLFSSSALAAVPVSLQWFDSFGNAVKPDFPTTTHWVWRKTNGEKSEKKPALLVKISLPVDLELESSPDSRAQLQKNPPTLTLETLSRVNMVNLKAHGSSGTPSSVGISIKLEPTRPTLLVDEYCQEIGLKVLPDDLAGTHLLVAVSCEKFENEIRVQFFHSDDAAWKSSNFLLSPSATDSVKTLQIALNDEGKPKSRINGEFIIEAKDGGSLTRYRIELSSPRDESEEIPAITTTVDTSSDSISNQRTLHLRAAPSAIFSRNLGMALTGAVSGRLEIPRIAERFEVAGLLQGTVVSSSAKFYELGVSGGYSWPLASDVIVHAGLGPTVLAHRPGNSEAESLQWTAGPEFSFSAELPGLFKRPVEIYARFVPLAFTLSLPRMALGSAVEIFPKTADRRRVFITGELAKVRQTTVISVGLQTQFF